MRSSKGVRLSRHCSTSLPPSPLIHLIMADNGDDVMELDSKPPALDEVPSDDVEEGKEVVVRNDLKSSSLTYPNTVILISIASLYLPMSVVPR